MRITRTIRANKLAVVDYGPDRAELWRSGLYVSSLIEQQQTVTAGDSAEDGDQAHDQ